MTGFWHDLCFRGLVAQSTDPELARLLDTESLVVYVGFDPTSASLQLGNLMGMLLLRRFQEAGHRPIAVAGGGTGMVGDPGGRSEERNLLDPDELAANLVGIAGQLGAFLDFTDAPGRPGALLVNNADWLGRLGLLEFLRDVGKHFTINQMAAKESVRTRIDAREQGISYTEFSYMLLQAYDFLHLYDVHGCRLQAGGSDQWGNITAGVELIRRVRAGQAYGLTTPLLTTPDGAKFGKSVGGAIWLDPRRTSPYAMYQFLLNTEDSVVGTYVRALTFLDHDRILELDEATAARPAAREAQRALAREVTATVHGRAQVAAVEAAASALFGGDLSSLDEHTFLEVLAEAPSSDVERSVLDPPGWDLVEALAASGLAPSRAAARRSIAEGGISVNNAPVQEPERRLGRADLLHDRYLVLRRGRRNHHVVRFVA